MAFDRNRPGIAAISGTATGLGRAFALELASHGWSIATCDIDEEGALRTLDEIEAAGGRGGFTRVDTANKENVGAWCDEVYEAWGRCDLLINNAGVAAVGDVGEMDIDLWDWVVGIDLLGPIYCSHYFLPRMRADGSGHILNIASAAAFAAAPTMGAYNVSKAGLVALSETMASELLDAPVGVTVACPTFFKTEIGNNTRGATPRHKKALDKLVNKSKLRPEAIANDILRAAERGKLYAVPQGDARAVWMVKRAVPAQFGKLAAYFAKRNG